MKQSELVQDLHWMTHLSNIQITQTDKQQIANWILSIMKMYVIQTSMNTSNAKHTKL